MTATLIILVIIILFAAWLGLRTLFYLLKSNMSVGFNLFKNLFLALIFLIIMGVLIYFYFKLKASGLLSLK